MCQQYTIRFNISTIVVGVDKLWNNIITIRGEIRGVEGGCC